MPRQSQSLPSFPSPDPSHLGQIDDKGGLNAAAIAIEHVLEDLAAGAVEINEGQ